MSSGINRVLRSNRAGRAMAVLALCAVCVCSALGSEPAYYLDETFDEGSGVFAGGSCANSPVVETGHNGWRVANLRYDNCPSDPGTVTFTGDTANMFSPSLPGNSGGYNGLYRPIPEEPENWTLTLDVYVTSAGASRPVPYVLVQHLNPTLFPGETEDVGFAAFSGQVLHLVKGPTAVSTGYALSFESWHTVELISTTAGSELRAWPTGGMRPLAPQAVGPSLGIAKRVLFRGPNFQGYDYDIDNVKLDGVGGPLTTVRSHLMEFADSSVVVHTDLGPQAATATGQFMVETRERKGIAAHTIYGNLYTSSVATSAGPTGEMLFRVSRRVPRNAFGVAPETVDVARNLPSLAINVSSFALLRTDELFDTVLGEAEGPDYTVSHWEGFSGVLDFNGAWSDTTMSYSGTVSYTLSVYSPLLGTVLSVQQAPVPLELISTSGHAEKGQGGAPVNTQPLFEKPFEIGLDFEVESGASWTEEKINSMVDRTKAIWCRCGVRVYRTMNVDGVKHPREEKRSIKITLKENGPSHFGGAKCSGIGELGNAHVTIGENVSCENTSMELVLAHEVGHALGLHQDKKGTTLMSNCAPNDTVTEAQCERIRGKSEDVRIAHWTVPSLSREMTQLRRTTGNPYLEPTFKKYWFQNTTGDVITDFHVTLTATGKVYHQQGIKPVAESFHFNFKDYVEELGNNQKREIHYSRGDIEANAIFGVLLGSKDTFTLDSAFFTKDGVSVGPALPLPGSDS